MTRYLVTGGTGFVGRPLVERLRRAGHEVTVLSRTPAANDPAHVTGDLADASVWRRVLNGADVVLHLAAATGKARPDAFRRVNVDGTRTLVGACRGTGVKRLVFISSVAAGFPDQRDYPYARSKAEAEMVVRGSGIAYTILRPTMILGPGAPVLGGLRALADRRVVLVPGRGTARVQPIHVDDVAQAVVTLLAADEFTGQTVDLGGPEVLPVEALLQAIRRALRGAPGRAVHLPLGVLIRVLRVLERVAFDALPVTAGQLSSFRFDGTASPHAARDARWRPETGVQAMLEASLAS